MNNLNKLLAELDEIIKEIRHYDESNYEELQRKLAAIGSAVHGEWISVEDELPTIGAAVMCRCVEDEDQIGYFIGVDDYGEEGLVYIFRNSRDRFITTVTHWKLNEEDR